MNSVVGPGGVAFPAAVLADKGGPANRVGGCAGCGSCCTRLTLPHSPEQLQQRKALLEAWEADIAAGDTRQRPFLPEPEDIEWGAQLVFVDTNLHGQHVYSCPRLDTASGLCTVHDARPPVCSGFPWYGRSPGDDTAEMPDGCSYQWELPLELRGPLTGGGGVHGVEGPTGPVGRLLPIWPVERDTARPGPAS